jgi:hypothetical protein
VVEEVLLLEKPKNVEKMTLYDENDEACKKCLCRNCELDCEFDDACSGCSEEWRDPTLYCWKVKEEKQK